jgi:uncharacterized protein (TIGR04255 family)
MSFAPAHQAHAIDKATATLTLGSAVVQSDDWLRVLQATLAFGQSRGFTSFAEGVAAAFNVAQAAPGQWPVEARTQMLSIGVGFKRLDDSGRPLVEFLVNRNEIRVDLYAYVRWKGFIALVLDLTSALLPAYPADLLVTQLKLEYWDRFLTADPQPVWSEVFRADRRLAAWAIASTDHWHTYMGWFDVEDGRKRLVNLHVDTNDQAAESGSPHRAANIYTMTATLNEAFPSADAATALGSRFSDLHALSKRAIGDVLNPAMQERISLFAQPEATQ